MIDIKEIKKTCPKSYELLKKWVKGQMVDFRKSIMQEQSPEQVFNVPEIEFTDDVISGWLLFSGNRQLFDFFDKNNINISITKYSDIWKWSVNAEESFNGNNRRDCEILAFKAAFEQLEKQL